MNLDLLTRLCETPGAPGREERVREIVRAELEPPADRVEVDPLGNLIGAARASGGPRLMLSAHMDEIGLMVTTSRRRLPAPDPARRLRREDADRPAGDRARPRGPAGRARRQAGPPDDRRGEAQRAEARGLLRGRRPAGRAGARAGAPRRRRDPRARHGPARRPRDLQEPRRPRRPLRDDRGDARARPSTLRGRGRRRRCRRRSACAARASRPRGSARPIALAIDITLANDGPGAEAARARHAARRRARRSRCTTPAPSCRGPWSTTSSPSARSAASRTSSRCCPAAAPTPGSRPLSGDGAPAGCVSIPTRYVHQVVEALHPDDLDASVALVVAFCETAQSLVE